jgi:hypothetical protein
MTRTLTLEQRRAATESVLVWLTETCGEDVANEWAWEHTPLPCGLPLDEQLERGLQFAALGRYAAIPLMAADQERYEQEAIEAMAARRRGRRRR